MPKKILVAYASKCGSTAEVAEVIGKALREQGASVDVLPVNKVTDISEYQGYCRGQRGAYGQMSVGSQKIRADPPESLTRKIQRVFCRMPVPCMKIQTKNARKPNITWSALRDIAEPQVTAVFAGKMDFSTLSFLDRMIIKMVKSPEGDFRPLGSDSRLGCQSCRDV